eukprot:6198437-Pleurochrysis_carterae.AAC.2
MPLSSRPFILSRCKLFIIVRIRLNDGSKTSTGVPCIGLKLKAVGMHLPCTLYVSCLGTTVFQRAL